MSASANGPGAVAGDDMTGAGRALDALIAEKVMGWKFRGYGNGGGEWTCGKKKMAFGGFDGGSLPNYSTSIVAAWLIAEKLRLGVVPSRLHAQRWRAVLRTNDGERYEEADTAPLAICLMALQAVGGE